MIIITRRQKMKLVIQRVKNAKVEVEGNIVGKIGKGFLVLVGITHTDTKKEADYLVKKLCKLRIFEDENGKMNLGLKDVGGELLIISQFTLYADCSEGNRPSFVNAAKPEMANVLYEYFCEECKKNEIKVEKGIFGADMKVSLLNDGPVTIILEK
ncbi:MAG TPA: D-tyrosyl-tRNA(Tyr) deacylase [Clostridiales bacterium]|nr:D-tyrosyl-tRNA(Tyr) deacylase [Clostridiales bacterium]